METKVTGSVDDYIAQYSGEVQSRLIQMRILIKSLAPDAVESIAYGMPAYKLMGKPLIYFGGFSSHIGLYAIPSGHEAFAKELAPYKQGKGSVQFPLSAPLPVTIIEKIILFRIKSVLEA